MATPSTSAPAPASSAFPLTTAARFPRSSACSVRASALAERRRTRRRRAPEGGGAGGDRSAAAGAVEKGLRLAFLEQLAERARAADAAGVADTIYDMVAAGLSPGPRSFHGLVAAHVLAGNAEGAVSAPPPNLLKYWPKALVRECLMRCLMKCACAARVMR
jgi:hypothetical protein